ncbi:MAG: ABC transporter permease [Rubrivivax sp.]|nr:ABC transporter permease [Rubrivivax sp.]
MAQAWALGPLVWREWRHHPWRHAVALLAVSLGVALAWSVHLINRSALGEFAAAVRSANGDPDLSLRGQREGFADAIFERAALDGSVRHASAVVEVETHARADAAAPRQAVRVVGIDALRIAALAPALMPLPARGEAGQVFLDAGVVFVNRAARERLLAAPPPTSASPQQLQLQAGPRWVTLRVAGDVAVGGGPLVVMDIAAAQLLFDFTGRVSRIDLRLAPGADAKQLAARLALPPLVRAVAPEAAEQRVSNLSRAYRINLTVLALVALFVGAFLVYSVVSLSVAQRTPAFALLGVLGLTARGRRALVLGECTLVGLAGGLAGIATGTAMATIALRALSGDLGGGYFPGVQPTLHWSTSAAILFVALGVASAVAGGYFPARAAECLQPAAALKGLGDPGGRAPQAWPALALLALGGALAFAPPVAGLPLAAYLSVAALLCGGVVWVPSVVHALTAVGNRSLAQPSAPAAPAMGAAQAGPPAGRTRAHRSPLGLLAWRRASYHRATATAATAGVVASLALSVALTVMVASFRTAVSDWLEEVLPADLYARSAATAAMAETAWLPPDFDTRVRRLPGVQRVSASRVRSLQLEPGRPAVSLMARPLASEPAVAGAPIVPPTAPQTALQTAPPAAAPAAAPAAPQTASPIATSPASTGATPPLALVSPALPPHGTLPDIFVSEAVVALYGARPGARFELPLATVARAESPAAASGTTTVHVRGVYRDFARQFGSVVIDRALYQRLTGDDRLTDLALWLAPGARPEAVMASVRALLPDAAMLDFATTGELRTVSLRIFDRSFAVTYYLQVVAIAIGLVGIAASLSAQVLARRKEFGLLTHLGLTRRQLLVLVTAEAAAWVAAGVLVGLLLGLAVSAVLVHVVNPQSFHWTMQMVLPAGRLAALCAAVFAAGTLTSAWAARGATARSAVLSVKEDW